MINDNHHEGAANLSYMPWYYLLFLYYNLSEFIFKTWLFTSKTKNIYITIFFVLYPVTQRYFNPVVSNIKSWFNLCYLFAIGYHTLSMWWYNRDSKNLFIYSYRKTVEIVLFKIRLTQQVFETDTMLRYQG